MMMREKIKIILIDDQPLFRAGIKSLLKEFPQFRLLFETDSTKNLTKIIKELTPDVIFIDVEKNLDKTIYSLQRRFPRVKILSPAYHNPGSLPLCRVKRGTHSMLQYYPLLPAAVVDFQRVFWHITEEIIRPMLRDFVNENIVWPKIKKPILTRREEEVLDLHYKGYKRKQVAEILNINVRTYDTLRDRITQKLGTEWISTSKDARPKQPKSSKKGGNRGS